MCKPTVCVCLQYDGGGSGGGVYGRRAIAGGDSSSTGRSSYLSGSSYRSPYYSRSSTSSYLSSPKDSKTRPATTSSSGGATERKDNKESERLSLRDKYFSGTYPGRARDSSYNSRDKDGADMGSSHRALGRSISAKSKTDANPETTPTSADVGGKADRVGCGSSISPYRLYSRSSYSRSISRDYASDATSSATSTPATTPVHTPSSLRFGSSSKYSSNAIRSPASEKPSSVFGHSSGGYSGRSISRSNSQQDSEESKTKDVTPGSTVATPTTENRKTTDLDNKKEKTEEEEVTQTTFITVVTRATSPTPPSAMSYIRTRRADLARVIEKTIEKPKMRPQVVDKEIQSERGDNTSRLSRYGVSSRWSTYLDRYPSAASSYSPVARYTSRYGYSSRSDDKETAIKSSAGQEFSESTSTNEASKTKSSTAVTNKDNAKDTVLPSQKLQTSPSDSCERRIDNDISSVKPPESVKTDVDKSMAKELNVTEVVESKETPRGITTVGSDTHKDRACVKSKTVSKENKETPAESLTKNYKTAKESEVDSLTQVKLAKNTKIKQSAQNTDAVPKSSTSISTVGTSGVTSSEGIESKFPADANIEGNNLVRIKSIKSSDVKFPTPTSTPQDGEVPNSIKSRNASSASLSSEDISDKTSSIEGNKTSDAVTGSAGLTRVKSFRNISGKSSAQTGIETPAGMKSRSSSVTSISSDELSVKTASVEGSISKTTSDQGSDGLGLSRTKSLKNVNAKPHVPTDAETTVRMKSKSVSSASLSSEGASDKASLNEGILLKMLSGDESQTNTPSNEVSLLKSSSNEGPLNKTSSLSTSCSKPLHNTPTCKLPPPFPKTDSNNQSLKTCSSLHSLNKFGVGNKDFRKSALNVELSSAVQAEAFKKQQEKQRHASTFERKFNRSNSMSSGDSDPSCGEGSSTHSLPIEVNSTLTALRTSKSLSKLYSNSSTSKLPSGTSNKDVIFPNQKSPDTTKSTFDAVKACCEPPLSPTGVQRHGSSDSDTDISSNESSSSSESSSSDEEDDGLAVKYLKSANLQQRTSRSPTVSDSQHISVIPATKVSSSDELCTSADKPPRPPVSPKPPKTDESKSFLMRALAPVTNLFRGKQENSNLEGLRRTSSTQSLIMSNKEDVEEKKLSTLDKCNFQDSVSDRSQKTETGSKINLGDGNIKFSHKYKIIKQESGERAWWLDSNPNIPEGIKRMESSTSVNKLKDVQKDCNKTDDMQKVSSNDSLDKPQERRESNGDNKAKIKQKSYKISHQQSGELPWWYNSNEALEGVKRIQSNSSANKLQGDEKAEVNIDKSEVVQKTSGGTSSHQKKISESDASTVPVGVENKKEKLNRLRHQQSGELPWWLDSSAPVPEGVQRIHSNSSINKLQDSDGEKTAGVVQKMKSNISINTLQDSDGNNKTTQGVQRMRSNSSVNKLQSSDSDSKKSAEGEKAEKKTNRIRHQESGELPWWLSNDTSHSDVTQRNKISPSESAVNEPEQKEEESNNRTFPYKLRHQESGEKAWWLSSRGDVPEGVKRFDSNYSLSECLKSGEGNQDNVESSPSENSEEDSSEANNKDKEKASGNGVPKFPLVLPSTAPGGNVSESKGEKKTGRRSPYDNIHEPELKAPKSQVTKSRPKHLPLFIGNHTNIDDILGTAATLVNPVMGLSRLRKKHDIRGEVSSNEEGKVNLTALIILLQA